MRSLEPGTYVSTEHQEIDSRPGWIDPAFLHLAGGVVHLLAFHPSRRRACENQQWHLCENVPRDAFVAAGDGSFVSSPELCFLQMATRLDFVELVVLGMELCGFYCIDPYSEEGTGQRVEPLTTHARLEAFLNEAENINGIKKARVALRYIMDGAASPMETAVVLVLTLPYKRGGYGLPRPELNCRIDLDEDAAKLCDNNYCIADLRWPGEHHLVLEYLGVLSHEGAPKMLADRGRTLALEQMGWDVIEITKDQAMDLAAFDVIARRIAKKLGRRLNKSKCGPTEERKRLFEVLYKEHSAVELEENTPDSRDEERVFGRRA